jgi:hypothetical protein
MDESVDLGRERNDDALIGGDECVDGQEATYRRRVEKAVVEARTHRLEVGLGEEVRAAVPVFGRLVSCRQYWQQLVALKRTSRYGDADGSSLILRKRSATAAHTSAPS